MFVVFARLFKCFSLYFCLTLKKGEHQLSQEKVFAGNTFIFQVVKMHWQNN